MGEESGENSIMSRFDMKDDKMAISGKHEARTVIKELGDQALPKQCEWISRSRTHREKFEKLLERLQKGEKVWAINGVRVCCKHEFQIGKGSEGTTVYIGLGADGSEMAVKRIPKTIVQDLDSTEKMIMTSPNAVTSNNVLRYFGYDDTSNEDFAYLIVDLCEENLYEFVKRQSEEELTRLAPGIIRQILQGLKDLHRSQPYQIRHRELTSTNIFRDVNDRWLVANFGISGVFSESDSLSAYYSKFHGNMFWRAVESYRYTERDGGKVRYKEQSVMNAAGMVSFYILTKGKHPFGHEADRLRNLLDDNPVGLDLLTDPSAKDLIRRMLQPKPEDRPSAEEALKHPYLQSDGAKFELPVRVDNQFEIKNKADSSTNKESPQQCECMPSSNTHREIIEKLRERLQKGEKFLEINGVRVCCKREFQIGEGSQGTTVYIGLDSDDDGKAVKRIPKTAVQNLSENERRILNSRNAVNSKNVLNYFCYDDKANDDFAYLIVDLCEENLKEFVERQSAEELTRLAPGIIRQILQGLEDLHRPQPNKILHRDLKPSNILRFVRGTNVRWLLADFGISRIVSEDDSTLYSSQSGTPHWRSVDSYHSATGTVVLEDGKVKYKKQSDIQVAGMVCFYILTKGKYAFGSVIDRLRNLLAGNPVGLDQIADPSAKDLIDKMLQHKPEDRPSAGEALKHPYLQSDDQPLV